ncbi:MAG TPA: phosphoserine transaminase [Sphingomonadales bacterium]|nr:phosphoserine transaminase [Sphingomonadales bacterium]
MKPNFRPNNPRFSSGPCTKRPGWTPDALKDALIGRSHRSKDAQRVLKEAVKRTRCVLGLPDDYQVVFTPASDTGAMEMAMWTMLGERPVDVLVFESFGQGWAQDVTDHLKLKDARVLAAPYGKLPDLSQVNPEHDLVFPWNGTTSGVCIPNGDFISEKREGLVLCDATSAIFSMALPWQKLDAVTYSWQKALGGEAQHGTLILSPRAIARLESYTPPWPVPKIFRLAKKGKVDRALFEGNTLNTPSMLVFADYLDALTWAESAGSAAGLERRTRANAEKVWAWIARTPWAENLASDPATRSTTSISITIVDPWFKAKSPEEQWALVKKMTGLLEAENAAFDIANHRDAPPGLRIWAGATVEESDLEALFPWLEWAFSEIRK